MKKYLEITHRSLSELGVATHRELWETAKQKGYEGLSLSVKTVFEKAAGDTFHAVFSTDSVDRHGDVVMQEPDLRAFRKNPVFLDSHNYDSIEHIIGGVQKIKARKEEGFMDGDIAFFTDNPKGLLARKGVEQGFINATSIGFIPTDFDERTGAITKWELLEISLVSVPANPEALFEKAADPTAVCCVTCGKELGEDEHVEVPTELDNVMELMCPACAAKAGKHAAPEPELAPAPEPVPEPKLNAAAIVARMAANDRAQLRMVARALGELAEEDRNGNKRKLLRALREIMQS